MSADSAVTYTSVHSEARSWSIPSEDPYEEAAQQLFEQAPRSPGEVRHLYLYSTIFLAHGLLPLSLLEHSRLEMRDVASAYYHSVHPSGTPQLLPIPLRAPSSSRRADVPEADAPPRKRLLLTTPRPGCEIGESSAAAAARQPGPTIETRLLDTERRMMTALELVNRRISYQAAVDLAVQHIMRPRPWRRGSVKFYGLLPASRRYRSFVLKMAPKRATRSTRAPPTPNEPTTTVTEAQLQALIDQGVAAAMAEAEASRVRNGYDGNGSCNTPKLGRSGIRVRGVLLQDQQHKIY
ncbi:hypothetical protein Tco_0702179, partial [Tanacetum coccineum]